MMINLRHYHQNRWMTRYRFNDDNNNVNYDDIDKEILQFEYEDSIGESETTDFHDYNEVLDATQQKKGISNWNGR